MYHKGRESTIHFIREQMCTTHCTCSHGHDNASEEGQVVPGVHPMPHGRQQEGGSSGVDRTALITHPEDRTDIKEASSFSLKFLATSI